MAIYEKTLRDEHTGEVAIIKSNDSLIFHQKIEKKQEQWAKRGARLDKQQEREDGLGEAEDKTQEAKEAIAAFKNILNHTLSVDDRIDWTKLRDNKHFKAFVPTQAPEVGRFIGAVPLKSFWEVFLPFLKRKRVEAEQKAHADFNFALNKFNDEESARKTDYEKKKVSYEAKQKKHNDGIAKHKADFEAGDAEAIQKYVEMVLDRSEYPENLDVSSDIFYVADKKVLLVEMEIPNPDSFPKIIEVKFVTSKGEFQEKEMKKADFEAFYEDTLSQISLRTIHEVFESIYSDSVDIVIFNGWVNGIDKKTGKDFKNCVISVQAERTQFTSLDLKRVSPIDCLKGLKAKMASALVNLAPTQPILHLDRNDKRIVEAQPVLGELDSETNLASMDWERFEHLVRDLFEKEFAGDGVEVKVTQASRDAGVDAIIFDPDPIKGGKFVIQCKRYNKTVGVSAVRDLYGCVMNEGAVKGILVTTSSFGKDSLEFVKDKPLTLISGSELLFLLNKHGHKFKIELARKTG
jgi:restriction system protein